MAAPIVDGPFQLIDLDRPLILGPDDTGAFDHDFKPAADGTSLDMISQVTTAELKVNGKPLLPLNVKSKVDTTNATVTTLATLALLNSTCYHLRAHVVGVKSDGSDRASYEIKATVYRTGGGSATIQGSQVAEYTVESNAGWACVIDVSGNDVRIRVTGIAATTIKWRGFIQVLPIGEAE